MSAETDTSLLAIVERLKASARRLSSAPDGTAEQSRSYSVNKVYPRGAAAFHQIGQLEQICRNEAAMLECAVKWLSALAGDTDATSAAWPPMETAGDVL